MTLFSSLGQYFRDRRFRRQAKKILCEIFESEKLLRGTSLKPHHRGRCDIIELDTTGDELTAFVFQILRHPRPHPFSKQHHLVAERWCYRIQEDALERAGSVNLSRLKGRDGEPPGSFP
ncbi:hypothetical protein CBD41_07970 [bacterium TMED181]|nr:hypothetical protein [Planctomycetota bacterium]OUW43053.1 MAG: hypothetical protein CBD41_07970 [bacterium TMED181]